ncbi:MAG TPA: DinB family protein [Thermoanaerobaculia bacterium]|nr:DinB family protein [Thermoanaerobaculia bacterium]
MIIRVLLVSVLVSAAALARENPPAATVAPVANPLSAHSMGVYKGVQKILLRTAETMPEENYGFKPADTVRTFGQILGHVAEAQYFFCAAVLGEKRPGSTVDASGTSKAGLISALTEAFAYCNRAYDGMTDASGTATVKFMGGEKPKLGVLNVNQVHTIEHYGNLVTYLRMNDLVPPTSDPEFMKSLMK